MNYYFLARTRNKGSLKFFLASNLSSLSFKGFNAIFVLTSAFFSTVFLCLSSVFFSACLFSQNKRLQNSDEIGTVTVRLSTLYNRWPWEWMFIRVRRHGSILRTKSSRNKNCLDFNRQTSDFIIWTHYRFITVLWNARYSIPIFLTKPTICTFCRFLANKIFFEKSLVSESGS